MIGVSMGLERPIDSVAFILSCRQDRDDRSRVDLAGFLVVVENRINYSRALRSWIGDQIANRVCGFVEKRSDRWTASHLSAPAFRERSFDQR